MGVIYIGDREVGKTALATELINSSHNIVNVENYDYESFKSLLFDEEEERFRPTEIIDNRYLEVCVRLPSGPKRIMVKWVDTPGEIWRSSWQSKNQGDWNNFLDLVSSSGGVLVILPPYRELLRPNIDSRKNFVLLEQWKKRFRNWVVFFNECCSKSRHVVLCLNKADLFCDHHEESQKLLKLNWRQRHSYIFNKYFIPVSKEIQEINGILSGLSVKCFITSIHNRILLELPWIYLASFLESDEEDGI